MTLKKFSRQWAWLAAVFFTATALAGPHKLRVTDRALAESLVAQGGRVLADYQGFQLIEVAALPSAKILGDHRVQVMDHFDTLQFNATTLNTRTLPTRSALLKPAAASPGSQLVVVQFVGPIKPEWRQALVQTGVKIVHYLPQNSYLVYGDAAALVQFQTWAAATSVVQWTGDYTGEYKVHPSARPGKAQALSARGSGDTFSIQLVEDPLGNAATLKLIGQWQLAPVVKSSGLHGYRNLVVALPREQLDTLAAQPDVVSIHPYTTPHKRDERQDQIVAGNLTGSQPGGPGYLSWLAGKGFTQAQFDASGFVVDVSDSGIDNGTVSPGHFALYPQANVSRPSRVVYNRFERTTFNSGATLAGCDGHGNLNAHIIGGYDVFTGGVHVDAQGYNHDLGVCPFVKIGSSVIFDNSGGANDFTDPDYSVLLTDAYNSGARISNNSWGGAGTGDYDFEAQTYDSLVRDVGAAGGHREMVVVFAAGNEGPGAQTIDSPGTAKNVLTVGASENVRSLSTLNGGNSATGKDGSGTGDIDANNANDLVGFSSRGPCADNRIKPDLVAPGSHILGGVPQAGSPITNGTGSAISCFNGTGVAGVPGSGTVGSPDNFFPLGQQFYTVSSGTSHATPAVAGACALLRQYFINLGLNPSHAPPSPAMTKAYLMNSARYLTGSGAGDTLPSPNQGVGAVNLGTAFDGAARVLRDQVAADTFTASGQARVFSGFVADPSKPLRITLAWTDAAGSTTASQALVNDLDLEVTIGGVTYLGNVFSGATAASGGAVDSLNNVESIFLPAGVFGPFTVTVSAANIAADAIDDGLAAPQQDFALVVYNGSTTPQPVIAPAGFSVVTEDCAPANGSVDPGETVTVNFTFQNRGTKNTSDLKITLLETNGVVQPSGRQTVGVLVTNGSTVTVPFTFTAAGMCGDTISPTFSLDDNGNDLGRVSVPVPLGTLATIYLQNFDGTVAPTLPVWWTTTAGGAQSAWTVSKKLSDTPTNAAFSPESSAVGLNALVSPALQLPHGGAQLSFRNNYQLTDQQPGFDGGVLEIKIGTNAFADILDAGGSFISGGYNKTMQSLTSSPLAGRQAWSGDSGGFITTTVNLPAAASGQTVQLRWRCGTDKGSAGNGWFIDTVELKAYWCCPDAPPLPPFQPAAGSYYGLFYDNNGVQVPSSGAFSATVNGRGSYRGTVQLGAAKYPVTGIFNPFGAASNRISRGTSAPLQVLLQMDTADNSRIIGTVGNGTWLAVLDAERSSWNALTNPAPFAGNYTIILPGTGNPADLTQPQGDSFGSLTVSAAGKVTFSGVLADNTPFTQTATVSENWQWPFFASLYGGKGQILGWLNFDNVVPQLGGVCNWIKPTNTTKFYPAGFILQTNATGSLYSPPATGVPLLNFTNGTATLLGGNYFTNFNQLATNTPANPLLYRGTNKLSFTLNSPTFGLFKGSVVDPVSLKTVSFKGALLQTQQVASGFFQGTNQSGKVSFGP